VRHLGKIRDRSFRYVLLTSALDPAWIVDDQVVIDCGGHNLLQKLVDLRCRVGTDPGGGELAVPLPDSDTIYVL